MKTVVQAFAISLAALCSYGAAADTFVSSHTIIVVEYQYDRILVAADSRQSGGGVDPNNPDRTCKIVPLGNKMFFVMAGRTGALNQEGQYVDAYAAAKQAFRKNSAAPNEKIRVKNVAVQWMEINDGRI